MNLTAKVIRPRKHKISGINPPYQPATCSLAKVIYFASKIILFVRQGNIILFLRQEDTKKILLLVRQEDIICEENNTVSKRRKHILQGKKYR